MSRSLAVSAICHSLLSQVTRPPHPPAPCCVPAPCPWLGTGAAMTWCQTDRPESHRRGGKVGVGWGAQTGCSPASSGAAVVRGVRGQLRGSWRALRPAPPRQGRAAQPRAAQPRPTCRGGGVGEGGPPTRLLIDAVAQGWAREWGHRTAARVPAGSSHRCSALGPRVPLPSPAPRPAPAWSCPSCSVGVWGPSPGLSFAAEGPELV